MTAQMNMSNLMPALGTQENAVDFANFDQAPAIETVRAICLPVSIDNVTRVVDVNAPFNPGRDKGTVRFRFMPLPTRFKAALCGILAALALGFPVGTAEAPTRHEISAKRLADKYTDRNPGGKPEDKPDDRRGQILREKRSEIHNSYSYLFSFVAGFVAGLIAGIGIIYTLLWSFASFFTPNNHGE